MCAGCFRRVAVDDEVVVPTMGPILTAGERFWRFHNGSGRERPVPTV